MKGRPDNGKVVARLLWRVVFIVSGVLAFFLAFTLLLTPCIWHFEMSVSFNSIFMTRKDWELLDSIDGREQNEMKTRCRIVVNSLWNASKWTFLQLARVNGADPRSEWTQRLVVVIRFLHSGM